MSPGEEGQTGRDRPQACWGAQAHGGSLQGQEGEEGFHDTGEEEEAQGKYIFVYFLDLIARKGCMT